MNTQKSMVLQNAYDNAMGRKLSAIGLAPSIQQGMMSPMESYLNRYLSGMSLIPGMTGAQSSPYMQGAGLLSSLGGMDLALQEGNMNRQYQEFIRQQDPMWLNAALGLATGFPSPAAQKPVVQSGGSGWMQMLGLLGSAGIGLLSDRNAKEDIVPYKGSVLKALRELDISTWKYIGEDEAHIGPMAQDLQRLFGVGDGRTVKVIDVMGILMAAAKEMAHAQAQGN